MRPAGPRRKAADASCSLLHVFGGEGSVAGAIQGKSYNQLSTIANKAKIAIPKNANLAQPAISAITRQTQCFPRRFLMSRDSVITASD